MVDISRRSSAGNIRSGGPSRVERRRGGRHNGQAAVIIHGVGAIPVENRYAERKKAEHEAKERGVAFGKRLEECWICGGTDHRRADCPKKFEYDDGKSVQKKVVCLGCRRRGHFLSECPERSGGLTIEPSQNVCFNCGESGHRLRDCTAPRASNGATYAECFICKEKGHLSRDCPKNTRGVYPRGGSCLACGSVRHFVSECPNDPHKKREGTEEVRDAEEEKPVLSKRLRNEDLEGNVDFSFEDDEERRNMKKKKSIEKGANYRNRR